MALKPATKATLLNHEITHLTPGLVRIRIRTSAEMVSFNPLIQDFPPYRTGKRKTTARAIELTTDEWKLCCSFNAKAPLKGISLELDGVIYTDLTAADTQNLTGVVYSLDTCDGWSFAGNGKPGTQMYRLELLPGLLSRRGWSLVKATPTDLTTDPEVETNEYYLFVYGRNYLQAVRDLYTLTGCVPLLPRWSLGTWYSRFQPLEPKDYCAAAKGFRTRGMGLDVIVGDMSWHSDNWYSLEYNRQRFGDMKRFLQWAKDNHLHVVFNHHPGGLETCDPRFPEFIRTCGFDLKKALRDVAQSKATTNTKAFHFDFENPELFSVYWDMFLQPLLDDGVSMHWIDGDASIQVLKLYYEHTQRHSPTRRAAILSRQKAGSLLNHKFPIAFSGDTQITWGSLEATVALTLAGAAQGVMWSHDIGGHFRGIDDEELFCRWLQSGVFSNFLRLHGSGGWGWVDTLKLERRPWKRGKLADQVAKRYIPLRYELLPYIETALRVQYDEGWPLTCPLYLRHPDEEFAYRLRESEYYFGPDIIVAPIVTKGVDGVTNREVWLPAGQWQDFRTGEFVEGEKGFRVQMPLLDMPIYLRAGAAIPLASPGDHTGASVNRLRVVPMNAPGTYTSRLYEDDGESMAYTQGLFRWTKFRYKRTKAYHTLTIDAAMGSYDDAETSRAWRIEVQGVDKPAGVKHNKKLLAKKAWQYDKTAKYLTIQLTESPVRQKQTIAIVIPS